MGKSELTFLSLWSINQGLEMIKLVEQLEELRQSGLDGVIFHPRNYPDDPVYLGDEYMQILSGVILHAKSIGMEFWIYDENGWPSGTAGGAVLAAYPGLVCQWIELDPIDGSSVTIKSKQAVSSLDPLATACFIEITHERYKNGLDPQAFDYVTGFFSDEVAFLDGYSVAVQYGGVPWAEQLVDQYKALYQEELIPLLPLLFIQAEGCEVFRARFWELLTDALKTGFYLPIKAWCEANGKRFTAHAKAEESPAFQLSYSGSCFQILKCTTVPAIDALERYPGNHFYPRIAHSIAAQFGNGNCLAEAMGGAGWGVKPQDFIQYMLWLAGQGINIYVFHLNQLRLNSHAVRDWPPSIPSHMAWKEAFPAVLAEIKQKAAELPDLMLPPELLIVTPTRGIMAAFEPHEAMLINEHDGSQIPDTASGRLNKEFLELVEQCYAAGIHYELTEERILEEYGSLEGNFLRIGNRRYPNILIAAGCKWNVDSAKMFEGFQKAGITLYNPDNWHSDFQKESMIKHDCTISQEVIKPVQARWKTEKPEFNLLAVEFDTVNPTKCVAMFKVDRLVNGIDLIVHDAVESVFINHIQIYGEWTQLVYVYPISLELLNEAENLLEIIPESGGEKQPIAFLRGDFFVISMSDFLEKDSNQVYTQGPFVLKAPTELDCNDLIGSGLPFCSKPVKVSKFFELADALEAGELILTELKADAAKVYVDGLVLGWCWGPDWSIKLKNRLTQGKHEVVIWLFPSTYNVYGPHLHMDGDRYLTSPAQYAGVKNFADRMEAPEITKGENWHFNRLNIQGEIHLRESGEP